MNSEHINTIRSNMYHTFKNLLLFKVCETHLCGELTSMINTLLITSGLFTLVLQKLSLK